MLIPMVKGETVFYLNTDEKPVQFRWMGLMQTKCMVCNRDKFNLERYWRLGNGANKMSMNGPTKMFKCKCQECGQEFECENVEGKLCDECVDLMDETADGELVEDEEYEE